MTGLLLKMAWSLAENWELGSRYCLCLKKVVLPTRLRSPLHFASQSQWYTFGIVAYIEQYQAKKYLGETERLLEEKVEDNKKQDLQMWHIL